MAEEESTPVVPTDMTELMKMFLEDHKRMERELTEERRRWDEEVARRERELAEERRRREEETERRVREMREQVHQLRELRETGNWGPRDRTRGSVDTLRLTNSRSQTISRLT